MSKPDIEQRIVFAVAPRGHGDGVPVMLVGMPPGAWDYMRDGLTHEVDLTRLGLPIKLVLYRGESHDGCMKIIEGHMQKSGVPALDLRRENFGFPKPKS